MQSSLAEVKIHQILEELDIPFEEEYVFDDLRAENGRQLRFDFAVFDDDGDIECLIEYNGRQHYVAIPKFGGAKGLYRQQYNDNMKRQYCKRNNIRLRTIPYTEEDNITCEYILRLIYN